MSPGVMLKQEQQLNFFQDGAYLPQTWWKEMAHDFSSVLLFGLDEKYCFAADSFNY